MTAKCLFRRVGGVVTQRIANPQQAIDFKRYAVRQTPGTGRERIVKVWQAALCALALAACTPTVEVTRAPTDPGTVVICDDRGGLNAEYVARLEAINARGQRVELCGRIDSAATVFLGADRVCARPGTRFGFHGSVDAQGRPAPHATVEIAQHYPPEIAAWFWNGPAWRYGPDDLEYLSAEVLARMTGMEMCE